MFKFPAMNSAKKTILKQNKDACAYLMHNCLLPRFENYDYCFRHILEDKSAPFKQCVYVNPSSNRRCLNATPKSDRKDNLHCSEHMRKTQLRHRYKLRSQPPRTAETLLSSLSHYVKPAKNKEAEVNGNAISQDLGSSENDKEPHVITKSLNPFVDIDAFTVSNKLNHILDYGSDTDSDIDIATIDDILRLKDEDSSDAESIDSDSEDLLKHATVLSPEEVILMARDKLQRLRNLYCDQFKRLQHLLKERRRDYLNRLQKEKESLCSIANQPRRTPKEHRMYQKLKFLNSHHKKFGVEAILHKKALEKKAVTLNGAAQKQQSGSKCIFTEGGVKCLRKTLPCSKFCYKHILDDPNQILFKRCGTLKVDSECQEPVMNIYNHEKCIYHSNIPPTEMVYNTSISSDSDEDLKEKNKRLALREVPIIIKTEIKEEIIVDSIMKDANEFENLSPSALFNTDKENETLMDFTEELPLQIMEGREAVQEEVFSEEIITELVKEQDQVVNLSDDVDIKEEVVEQEIKEEEYAVPDDNFVVVAEEETISIEQEITQQEFDIAEECLIQDEVEIDVCNE